MQRQLYDIEVFPNYFCVGLKDYDTKEILFYEISEEKNDIELIYNFFTRYNGFLIGFNSIHYDNMIIKYLILNYDKYKSYHYGDICFDLKWFSDKVINGDFDDLVKKIKYQKVPWTDIDLFLYWSKGLRISKKISLKSLGIQLGYPVVQELPFKPDTVLRLEDLDKVRVYNYTHDLGILDLLTSKMEPDIELRKYILEEYGLECWSYDAPKIASEYLLEYTCRKLYRNKSIPYWEYKRNIRNYRYNTSSWRVGDYLPKVKFKTKFFHDIYKDFCDTRSDNQSIKDILFEQKSGENLIISVSSGGLHTINNNQKFSETDDYYLRDADIASLYPTLFRKHKFLRKELQVVLDKYLDVIDDRIEAKRAGNKRKDTFLKLILNSFSGLVDSNVTWMYSPQEILALRVFGQLIQLRFIEELNEVGITTIFSNTDGTLAKVPRHLSDKYNEIALNIAKEFEVTWEFCDLEFINFSNTNTYISKINKEFMLDENLNEINVKEKVKIKRKGKYFRLYEDIPLGDATDCLIINKALQAFYLDDIQPEEYISNPEKYNHHIYDYCKSNKISKNYVVYHNNQVVQNLNRYYFSKNQPYLYKQKDGVGTMHHVNVGQGVILYNEHKNLPWEEYNIDYVYYISSTKKIINEINNNNQLTLF